MPSGATPRRSWPPRSRPPAPRLTEVFGVGPVIAGTVVGDVADVSRFPSRDHFAAYNGTAPVEVSSGNRKIHRLSLRGNRRVNHAIHMAAITQIRHRHSDGRAYYEQEARRGQDPQGSAPLPQAPDQRRHLRPPPADAPHGRVSPAGPGRATGERLWLQRGRLTPRTPALRTSHSRTRAPAYGPGNVHAGHASTRAVSEENPDEPLDNADNKEDSICTTAAARCWRR